MFFSSRPPGMRCGLMLMVASLVWVSGVASQTPSRLNEGKFGKALELGRDGRYLVIPWKAAVEKRPITIEAWVCLTAFDGYNILFAAAPKSGAHWEVYTAPTNGEVSVYIPQVGDHRSGVLLERGRWHFLSFRLEEKAFSLFVDGKKALGKEFPNALVFDQSALMVGRIETDGMSMTGSIDDLRITYSTQSLEGYVPEGPAQAREGDLALFSFDEIDEQKEVVPNAMGVNAGPEAAIHDGLSIPKGDRFLDEVQEEAFSKSTLHGDEFVEYDSTLPKTEVQAQRARIQPEAVPSQRISLDGEWMLKESAPRLAADLKAQRLKPEESEGVKNRWFKEGFDRSGWRKVTVPTSVQSALMRIGEIENPLLGDNTWKELHEFGEPKDFAWHHRKTRIEQKDWWFARSFTVPSEWKDKSIRLSFDGIDYAGSIYVNGNPLGYHAGMFGGPDLDISRLVRFDAPNEVVVRVDSIPESWFGILKGSPGWGWHYGHLVSLGIWRSVWLETVPQIEIQHPYVHTLSLKDGQAELMVEYTLQNASAQAQSTEVSFEIRGETFESKPLLLSSQVKTPSGRSRYQTRVKVADAKPWWPMNYGDPDLYKITVSVTPLGSARPVSNQESLFGIRTIEMHPLRGQAEEKDYRWQFVINGIPMFIKGANWCWSDPMLELDPVKYEHILELARRAGVQMFRSWGGGIIETDEFYRLCDKKGLMVYQEFPYCWMPPDFPLTDPRVLDDQVSRVVQRLRNHPSLIMWGGGNENVEISGADEGLFLVGRRCRQYDPSRPFHRTSPWGGSFHNWGVFHNGLPYDTGFTQNPSVFYGEFGTPSMNNYEETALYLGEERLKQWPPAQDDGAVQMHMNQFGYGDMAKVMRYCDYGPIKSWKDYIEYSQMAQGDEIRFTANFQRAGSYLNKSGLWFYKMTDLFPGHSWAVVGFYGHPKLSYYQAKHVYQPQAAFAFTEKLNWEPNEPFTTTLHVSNDSTKPLENAVVRAVVYGSDLLEQWSKEYPVASVKTAERLELERVTAELDPGKIKPFLLAVSMRDREGNLISDQWSWFNYQVKTEATKKVEEIPAWGWPHERAPEAFEAYGNLPEARLLTLPKAQLQAAFSQKERAGSIRVKNLGQVPAFNVIIDGFPGGYGNLLDDNSFSLYPGEERTLSFETAQGVAVKGLNVRAWNAESVAISQE